MENIRLPKDIPTVSKIEDARIRLNKYIMTTPVWPYRSNVLSELLGKNAEVFCKLELFQCTGSFKPRGALLNILNISPKTLSRGIVAASAGNHAIAVAFSGKKLKTNVKVVMPKTASPSRINKCRSFGAEVILVDNISKVFEEMETIKTEEQRESIHPFEGSNVALGTGTIGYELSQQVDSLDAVIVPIGGGGLCAGIATAIKQLQPRCKIYGVEPEGANTMQKSFVAGSPQSIPAIDTIADSLGAPYALPYSFSLCYAFVDEIMSISDADLCNAMRMYFDDLKLAVEPAGAASLAALVGPLRSKLQNKRVGLIVSGTNIDADRYCDYIHRTA